MGGINRTRREFLGDALIAATALTGAGACARDDKESSVAPSDRLGVAILGARGFGMRHIAAYGRMKDCEILYIVDPDAAVGAHGAATAARLQKRTPTVVADLREALADDNVDLISIATPDHWHAVAAIWSMQAGKDVYVEKPVSNVVSEGRDMIHVARKLGRMCQAGTHRRSFTTFAAGVAALRKGEIGEISHARCLSYIVRNAIGAAGDYPVPDGVNYDLWLGPAPQRTLARKRFHYDWHWFWDYGGGGLGNNGVHRIDVARWALGVQGLGDEVFSYGGRYGRPDAGETPNTQVVVHTFANQSIVQEVRGLKSASYDGLANGVVVYGEDGYVTFAGGAVGVFDANAKRRRVIKPKHASHFKNFVKAVRSRNYQDLTADVEEGHASSALCHIGNISHRVGAPASVAEVRARLEALDSRDELVARFEATTAHLAGHGVDLATTPLRMGEVLRIAHGEDRFVDAEAANALLTTTHRAPYTYALS